MRRQLGLPQETSVAGRRQAVVVLGMHRSGTSALCGALDRLGVDFGGRLMPATDWNAKGHWEHQEIVDLHDALLYAHGSRWDDDEPLRAGWAEADVTRDARAQLIAILERDFRESAIFGIKDPRMCRLLALWRAVFEAAEVEPHYAFVLRHPWESGRIARAARWHRSREELFALARACPAGGTGDARREASLCPLRRSSR
jgi:hypothetical protein